MSHARESQRGPAIPHALIDFAHGSRPQTVAQLPGQSRPPSLYGGELVGGPVLRETVFCDICGSPMIGVHCKLRCVECGYSRDCSDP